MKESFLHYLWQFKKFDVTSLLTTDGLPITLVQTGNYLQQAGPDFFNSQLIIGTQKWAGNVEIHLKSSDWYVHHHELDPAYENVILHVVWEHDIDVFRKNNTKIPVLELKNYVDSEVLLQYQKLLTPKKWINCEHDLHTIDDFTLIYWKEQLFIERMTLRQKEIDDLLVQTTNDWEAVFFLLLAKGFGLNTNGVIFFELMQSIPYAVIRKEKFDPVQLEALFFGRANLLEVDSEDLYFTLLKKYWNNQQHKYQFETKVVPPVQFFKHRPDNFPTIRLSQLAQLLHKETQLFQQCMNAQSVSDFYELFAVSVSDYWKTHYVFDKEHKLSNKKLTTSFIDLLLINSVLPVLFAYNRYQGKDAIEQLISIASQLKPEKNTIIEKFMQLGITSQSGFDTQSYLHLKKHYCDLNKCLGCAIGQKLINFTTTK